MFKSEKYYGQELNLFRIYSCLNVVSALIFMPLATQYIQPAFIQWMYVLLGFIILGSVLLLVYTKEHNYQLGSILLISLISLVSVLSLLLHQQDYILFSTLLVFSFIIIANVLLSTWPTVLWFDVAILLCAVLFMIHPQTEFLNSVKSYNVDPKYSIIVIAIYYVSLMVWGTSMVEIKRRTEGKLRYINENLNSLVEEKVTQLRLADKEKREYREQVESIFHHIPVGVVIVDHELNFLYTNGVHFNFNIVDDKIDELPGGILPLDVLKKYFLQDKLEQLIECNEDLIGQRFEFTGADGLKRILRYSCVCVHLEDEEDTVNRVRLVLITEDITHEEALRDKLIRTDHLAEMGKMAASLAHEVNNPLAGIKLYLELLEQGIHEPEKRKKIFETLDNSIARIDRIIKGFLTFARQDKPRKDWLDIAIVVKETLEMVAGFKPMHDVHITTDFPEKLPQISADRFKLGQVFLNLLNNAKDAMEENGGALAISCESKGKELLIHFKDSGKGIKQEDLPHVFTPFYTTKERGHGTGLGLSTSYGIIQEHGGYIEVESREGVGTTFTIRLPIKHKSDNADSEASKVKHTNS